MSRFFNNFVCFFDIHSIQFFDRSICFETQRYQKIFAEFPFIAENIKISILSI